MKRTVGRWTAIQNKLPTDEAGDDLWNLIEYRTWGKRGQQQVPIKLNKSQEEMVEGAEGQLAPKEEHAA